MAREERCICHCGGAYHGRGVAGGRGQDGLVFCEDEMYRPDREDPGYSQAEIDFYAWIPSGSGVQNHRLSVRMNLVSLEFEVYRAYAQAVVVSRRETTMISNVEDEREEVIFSSKDFQAALDKASEEAARFHGDHPRDLACQHEPPAISSLCMRRDAYCPTGFYKLKASCGNAHDCNPRACIEARRRVALSTKGDS